MRRRKGFLVGMLAAALLAAAGRPVRAEEAETVTEETVSQAEEAAALTGEPASQTEEAAALTGEPASQTEEATALTEEAAAVPEGAGVAIEEVTADLYQAGALRTDASWIAVYDLRTAGVEAQIYQDLSRMSGSTDLTGLGLGPEELKAVFEKVVNGHPELFYVSNRFGYVPANDGSVSRANWRYSEQDPAKVAAMKSAMEQRVSSILAKTDASMTDAEKLMILHEELVAGVTYSMVTSWNNGQGCYTAYAALVEGKAVCHGYALAFDLLAERLGIPTEFVASDALNHAWNLVYLGGKTYHVDCTWDDMDVAGEVLHRNFLLSDSGIRGTGHTNWNDRSLSGNGTEYDDYYWRGQEYRFAFVWKDALWYQVRGREVSEWRRIGASLFRPETGPWTEVNRGRASVRYRTHVQSYGWLGAVSDGAESGTTGEAKRLESIVINLDNAPVSGGIEYRTHVQTFGWLDWVPGGAESGTTGLGKRLEAIQIRLTGEMADRYDVYYRVHRQTFDWTGWAKNGAPCGSMGYAKRLEAIQIVLVEKGGAAPGRTTDTYVEDLKVTYQTHVQTFGWQAETSNGVANGTTGLAKRLEGIKIRLENHFLTEGSIEYRTHVQTFGWQDWVKEGELAGTTGLAKRLEAIEIRLTGDMEKNYDIYYRVHCQSFGWTGWAKNGAPCGSEGYYKRLEAIEIRLVHKGATVPGATENAFMKV